jgi:hypothetical protein
LNSRLDYVPSERYEDIRNFVVRAPAEGATLFNSPDNQASYVLVRRTKPGNVEEHSRWDDLIIVQSGTGDVEVGAKNQGRALHGRRGASRWHDHLTVTSLATHRRHRTHPSWRPTRVYANRERSLRVPVDQSSSA